MAERVKPTSHGTAMPPKKMLAGPIVKGEGAYLKGPYKSGSQQGRVLAKRLLGQSKRKIAQSEGIDRETVGRILSQEDMKAAILDARKKFVGLLPKALIVYELALDAQKGQHAMAAARHILEGSQTAVPKTESLIEMSGAEGDRSTEDQFFRALHNHWPEEPCHCNDGGGKTGDNTKKGKV